MTSPPRAWAEINLAALDQNLAFVRAHSNQSVMAVLKAGAYGHGLPELARHLDPHGLAYFGVANVGEARSLADAGIQTPLYLLSPTFPDERAEVVARGWTPSLSTHHEIDQFARLCAATGKPLRAHITLDTGMGRGGFLPSQLAAALDYLALPQNKSIYVKGISSHLPSADEDPEFTRQQFASFDALVEEHRSTLDQLCKRGGSSDDLQIHLSNGAGLLGYQSITTNLVRPGLLLYGVSPLPHWQDRVRPVMTLKSRVSLVRTLPKGHGVSYGRSHILEQDTAVATIGIGYGDGLPRSLASAEAHVLIKGQKAPLLGRVTMDQIMVDVSHLPEVQPGDEVELYGPNLPVTQVAAWAETIPWEVLTRITPRVLRIYS